MQGDRKNDGYLKSEQRVFQVYAPNEMNAARATAQSGRLPEAILALEETSGRLFMSRQAA